MGRWEYHSDRLEINDFLGLIFSRVLNGADEIRFELADGSGALIMGHEQSCCESVYVEDVAGDLGDLVGAPIVRAEAPSSLDGKNAGSADVEDGDEEWTFYILGTSRGTVTIRWYGSSNGYYSTSVHIWKEKTSS